MQNYNETPCTVDCRITGWTDWSGCSETCGDGVEYKDPIIGDQAQHGGEACPAAQERVSLLEMLALCCEQRGNYQLAAKKSDFDTCAPPAPQHL